MSFEEYDQLLSPILVIDPDGKIKYYNHICTVFFKQSPRKLTKIKNIQDLIPTKETDLNKIANSVLVDNVAQTTPEISFQTNELGEMTVILKMLPIGKDVLINILDFSIEKKLHEKYKKQVSDLKETHEQILKADKLTSLGEMIAGISHEVSTPLTIVNSQLEQLSDAIENDKIVRSVKILKSLKKEYQRVLRIISGMQSFVRNQEDDLIITNIEYVLNDVKSFFNKLNPDNEIEIEVGLQSSHWVLANPIKLQQAFINLIKNSMDAIRGANINDGKIIINVIEDLDSQSHIISVKDNGPGINKDSLESIFDMFFTSKNIDEGTGLGLSITKKIIESFEGNIVCLPVNSGSEFEITLPLIEISSFTRTNKYLLGEVDSEDEKLLFIGTDIKLQNSIYQAMKDKNYVLIFSNKIESIEAMADFLMIDHVVKLSEVNCEFAFEKSYDFSKLSASKVLSKLKDEF